MDAGLRQVSNKVRRSLSVRASHFVRATQDLRPFDKLRAGSGLTMFRSYGADVGRGWVLWITTNDGCQLAPRVERGGD